MSMTEIYVQKHVQKVMQLQLPYKLAFLVLFQDKQHSLPCIIWSMFCDL